MSKNDHLSAKLCYTIPKLIEIYREKKAIWHGQLQIPLANRKKGGRIHMSEWYKKEITKMLAMIDDEEYLKKLYIIISNHNEKED